MRPTRWPHFFLAIAVVTLATAACSSDGDSGAGAGPGDAASDSVAGDGASDLLDAGTDAAGDTSPDGAVDASGGDATADLPGEDATDDTRRDTTTEDGVEDSGLEDLPDDGRPDAGDTTSGCIAHIQCSENPAGEVCDFETGECVECTSDDHCVDNPDGWRCGPDHQCHTVEGCIHHADCVGHPDGELCVFFEERCGECLDNDDCPEDQGCGSDFTCGPWTDENCAAEDHSRPYAYEGACVECRIDDDCESAYRDHCNGDNECVECLNDDHCTADYAPYCDDGHCGRCKNDDQCTDDAYPYCIEGYCTGCDPDLCGGDTPLCSSTECVECTSYYDCDPDAGIYCNDNECVLEDIECDGGGDCDDHAALDHCADFGRCVACTRNSHCRLGGIIGDDVCDEATGTCVDCVDDDDCDNENRPYCGDDNNCVECATDGDCVGNPDGPVCTSYGFCSECGTNADCAGHPNGEYCVDEWFCGECLTEDHCTGDDVCDDGRCACEDRFDRCFLDMATYVCGTYVDNCDGRFDCGECGEGGTCSDGGRDCDCPLDVFDAEDFNDTEATASSLPDMTDAPASSAELVALSIDADSDEDWFTVHVDDDFDAGNPNLYLTLAVTPPQSAAGDLEDDSEYELTMWLQCDNGTPEQNDSTCDGRVSPETDYGIGCYARGDGSPPLALTAQFNCPGINDSGVATIRVRKLERFGRCDSYDLDIVAD